MLSHDFMSEFMNYEGYGEHKRYGDEDLRIVVKCRVEV